jgi:TRAP-type C4-dicarboxylate transport system permease small subunit
MIHVERCIGMVAAVSLAVFTGIVLLDVVFRYWLHIPLSWPAESSVLCFQWMVFLGAPVALRRGLHFGVNVGLDHLPPAARRIADIFIGLTIFATSVAVAILAWRLAVQNWNETFATLPLPRGAIYVGLCFSGIACALFGAEQTVRHCRSSEVAR